ncbi:Scr1 family TA system antitoxin-like transcriptional regulator [Actinoallomurus iriomotensis]|uniref:Scr1 family TA system antitoxin-like transcriptional regulator n=1 Tax=Actinoallomurus iriomotensis TaxID=478107 RepID=UPI003D7F9874
MSGARDIEAALAERTERKRNLVGRENPPFIWALMDESVLACSVEGPQVMRDQLEHRPNDRGDTGGEGTERKIRPYRRESRVGG